MSNRPLFKLSPRLLTCAQNVRVGKKLVDVGTDHAYLPIWLAKKGQVSSAIAADINAGPLEQAKKNIIKYKVDLVVRTVLSNGLSEINENDADDIVIAGMGGDVITRILQDVAWIRNPEKRLILQPMTCEEKVRLFLCENGFDILTETTVKSEGRVYVVMVCVWTGQKISYDNTFTYMGRVLEKTKETNKEYFKKVISHLKNKSCAQEAREESLTIITKIEEVLKNDSC